MYLKMKTAMAVVVASMAQSSRMHWRERQALGRNHNSGFLLPMHKGCVKSRQIKRARQRARKGK